MKNLMKYLSPFAPDISGAVEVLFEMSGLVVIVDAGGCTGNVCGFDEPRWFHERSAVFSAGLRDLDAILGRDRLMIEKTGRVLQDMDANFVAFIGTPVPSVIGTDFKGLANQAQKQFGIPAFAIDTNGMELCDRGASKTYRVLVKYALEQADKTSGSDDALLVLGCTPMDLAPGDTMEAVRERLLDDGKYSRVIIAGEDFSDLAEIPSVSETLVIAPSGIAAAKELQKRCGIPWKTGYPLSEEMKELSGQLADDDKQDEKILIVHQAVLAESLRKEIEGRNSGAAVSTGTFFDISAGEDTVHFRDESGFIEFVMNGKFDRICADPLLWRAVRDCGADFTELAHFAVSGSCEAERPEI